MYGNSGVLREAVDYVSAAREHRNNTVSSDNLG